MLARALDYEKIPGGAISLTIMALDGGSPPLNSTVTAIVEVFVRFSASKSPLACIVISLSYFHPTLLRSDQFQSVTKENVRVGLLSS